MGPALCSPFCPGRPSHRSHDVQSAWDGLSLKHCRQPHSSRQPPARTRPFLSAPACLSIDWWTCGAFPLRLSGIAVDGAGPCGDTSWPISVPSGDILGQRGWCPCFQGTAGLSAACEGELCPLPRHGRGWLAVTTAVPVGVMVSRPSSLRTGPRLLGHLCVCRNALSHVRCATCVIC